MVEHTIQDGVKLTGGQRVVQTHAQISLIATLLEPCTTFNQHHVT